jgi:hypothetical protein
MYFIGNKLILADIYCLAKANNKGFPLLLGQFGSCRHLFGTSKSID